MHAAVTLEATAREKAHMWVTPPVQKLCSDNTFQPTASFRSSVYRWKHKQNYQASPQHYRNQQEKTRGTLGIVLHETTPRPFSNVDASAWNGAPTWELPEDATAAAAGGGGGGSSGTSHTTADPNVPFPSHSRPNRLVWSNFAPSYQVMDRVQKERPDLNLEEWQAELLAQEPRDAQLLQNPADASLTSSASSKSSSSSSSAVNSLAEWVRTVDLEPLLQRREEIHRQKRHGKRRPAKRPTIHTSLREGTSREELVQSLTKLLDTSARTKYSNYEVKQMYAAAKLADQQGQRHVAQQILEQLIDATPKDGRLYRRLARLHKEEGRWSEARATLHRGLRVDPKNAFLWHGLGTLAANDADAKKFFRRALRCDPYLAQSYHALGTLQHTQGRIAQAMQTLQKGIAQCPTNHRLHHAMGDLYREAKMLPLATKAYRKVLEMGPSTSHGFAYTALSYVAYEQGNVAAARRWLTQATELNHGRTVNAWKSLALLEEAEGRPDRARQICRIALDKYEKGLLMYHQRRRRRQHRHDRHEPSLSRNSTTTTTVAVKNALLGSVPVYRSGDRFFQLYRTWTRLEERFGTPQSVEAVYTRATAAFPYKTKIWMDWADWHVRQGHHTKARVAFATACRSAKDGLPYRRFAEFEMSRSNHETARKILFRGALFLSQAETADGLAELYHTWAVAEWHLEDMNRAELLLDHALRLTPTGTEGAALRSTLLYTLASLQHYNDEHLLAQHCIALCLKENVGPTSHLWKLWTDVALAMDNDSLAAQCRTQFQQAQTSKELDVMSSFLSGSKKPVSSGLQDKMRRDPWHSKIFAPGRPSDSPFAYEVGLPSRDNAVRVASNE